MLEPYFNVIGFADIIWSRFIQYSDVLVGFGQNWIMQGSILNTNSNSKIENYIFLIGSRHSHFVKKYRKKFVAIKEVELQLFQF